MTRGRQKSDDEEKKEQIEGRAEKKVIVAESGVKI
jgi:hypothetical protein